MGENRKRPWPFAFFDRFFGIGSALSTVLHGSVAALLILGLPILSELLDKESVPSYRRVDVVIYSERDDPSVARGHGVVSPYAHKFARGTRNTRAGVAGERRRSTTGAIQAADAADAQPRESVSRATGADGQDSVLAPHPTTAETDERNPTAVRNEDGQADGRDIAIPSQLGRDPAEATETVAQARPAPDGAGTEAADPGTARDADARAAAAIDEPDGAAPAGTPDSPSPAPVTELAPRPRTAETEAPDEIARDDVRPLPAGIEEAPERLQEAPQQATDALASAAPGEDVASDDESVAATAVPDVAESSDGTAGQVPATAQQALLGSITDIQPSTQLAAAAPAPSVGVRPTPDPDNSSAPGPAPAVAPAALVLGGDGAIGSVELPQVPAPALAPDDADAPQPGASTAAADGTPGAPSRPISLVTALAGNRTNAPAETAIAADTIAPATASQLTSTAVSLSLPPDPVPPATPALAASDIPGAPANHTNEPSGTPAAPTTEISAVSATPVDEAVPTLAALRNQPPPSPSVTLAQTGAGSTELPYMLMMQVLPGLDPVLTAAIAAPEKNAAPALTARRSPSASSPPPIAATPTPNTGSRAAT